jgi:hypothetical protein
LQKAIAERDDALRIVEEFLEWESAGYPMTHNEYGVAFAATGAFDAARELLEAME